MINGFVVLFCKTWEYLGSKLHDFAGPPRIDQELLPRPDMLASMINQLYNHSSRLKWYLFECIYVGHQETFAWSFHRYLYCLLSDDHYEKCYYDKYVPCHISLLTTSHSLYHSALLLKIAFTCIQSTIGLITYRCWLIHLELKLVPNDNIVKFHVQEFFFVLNNWPTQIQLELEPSAMSEATKSDSIIGASNCSGSIWLRTLERLWLWAIELTNRLRLWAIGLTNRLQLQVLELIKWFWDGSLTFWNWSTSFTILNGLL